VIYCREPVDKNANRRGGPGANRCDDADCATDEIAGLVIARDVVMAYAVGRTPPIAVDSRVAVLQRDVVISNLVDAPIRADGELPSGNLCIGDRQTRDQGVDILGREPVNDRAWSGQYQPAACARMDVR